MPEAAPPCITCGREVQWHPQSDDFGVCSSCGKDQFPEPGEGTTTVRRGTGYGFEAMVLALFCVLAFAGLCLVIFGVYR